jgi:hypothetical protein
VTKFGNAVGAVADGTRKVDNIPAGSLDWTNPSNDALYNAPAPKPAAAKPQTSDLAFKQRALNYVKANPIKTAAAVTVAGSVAVGAANIIAPALAPQEVTSILPASSEGSLFSGTPTGNVVSASGLPQVAGLPNFLTDGSGPPQPLQQAPQAAMGIPQGPISSEIDAALADLNQKLDTRDKMFEHTGIGDGKLDVGPIGSVHDNPSPTVGSRQQQNGYGGAWNWNNSGNSQNNFGSVPGSINPSYF